MDSGSLIGDIAQNVQDIRLTRSAQSQSLLFFEAIAGTYIRWTISTPVAACTIALYGHGIDALARCRSQ